MTRVNPAVVLRWLLVTGGVAAVLVAVVRGGLVAIAKSGYSPVTTKPVKMTLPFLAVGLATVALFLAWPLLERTVTRVAGRSLTSPYSALAEAARRIQGGSLEQVLPGLARVLAEGTGAVRGAVWLAMGDRLVEAVHHPPDTGSGTPPGRTVPGVADLLVDPDIDFVVPVLYGEVLRAALTITKPGPITAADRELLHDVANGSAPPRRVGALPAQPSERLRRRRR